MTNSDDLTHVDTTGAVHMVDTSGKSVTVREAVASGRVVTTAEVIRLLRRDGLPKGDALATARIAGIMGAKRTPEIVPLCHPIALSGVTITLELTGSAIGITAVTRTADRTGVEMEALTAVATAGLALIDMIKAVDPAATIEAVRVERKAGGKTGTWRRDGTDAAPDAAPADPPATADPGGRPIHARVVVASNRAAAGVYADTSGPLLADGLRALGCDVEDVVVVPDGEPVTAALRAALTEGADLVVTSGGTGVNPTDRTPEATREVLDYEVPGIAEALRAKGAGTVPAAALSRGLAGVAGRTLIVNLPGSRGGARDGLAVLGPILAHTIDQLRGGDHPAPPTGTA